MIKTVILAAGEGTRMKSEKSKVLHKILNKTILSYIIDAVNFGDDSEIIIVAGKNYYDLKNMYPEMIIKKQEIGKNIPYGTGYATSLCIDEIKDGDTVLVLNGDIPLIKKESISEFLRKHKENDDDGSVLSVKIKDPSGYGRIVRKNNEFVKIIEEKDADENQRKIDEINSGIYAFKGKELKDSLKKLNSKNKSKELYLTDCIGILNSEGKKVNAFENKNYKEFFGINNKYELSFANEIMRERVNEKYMIEGVIIENPSITTIQPGVKIGNDTEISGCVSILGNTTIGKNCIIKGSCRIENSQIGDNVIIDNSIIEESKIENGVDIGPFSHLRPNAMLKENVHIGNFVEVKNSTVGEKTKAGHLAYIGDSDIGKNVNIGCGVIFVNYDGTFKHRSIVKDNAFIGSNSNIVAPVTIENEGYIAAGSTITENVAKGELSIERSKQINKPGYVEKKKIRDEKLKEEK